MTSIKLSWQPPSVTNGNIKQYIVSYFSLGPAVPPSPPAFTDPAMMLNYSADVHNDSNIMTDLFDTFHGNVSLDRSTLESIMHVCIYIFTNETVLESLKADGNFTEADNIFQMYNLSDMIVDWLKGANQTVIVFCDSLKAATEEIAHMEDEAGITLHLILNQT